MKGVIFDFGGTLDTNGIHWSEKFYDVYLNTGIPLEKKIFEKAYLKAEPEVGNYITAGSMFSDVLKAQVNLQFDFLAEEVRLFSFLKKSAVTSRIVNECYNDVLAVVAISREVLEQLKGKYSLGIVSNFYGNLETVLKEFELFGYFDSIIDSKCAGVKKPDPEIYKMVLSSMNLSAGECVMIGDSYNSDIIPAKLAGMHTIWLKGRSWEKPEDQKKADRIINSIEEIKEIL